LTSSINNTQHLHFTGHSEEDFAEINGIPAMWKPAVKGVIVQTVQFNPASNSMAGALVAPVESLGQNQGIRVNINRSRMMSK